MLSYFMSYCDTLRYVMFEVTRYVKNCRTLYHYRFQLVVVLISLLENRNQRNQDNLYVPLNYNGGWP